MPDEFDLIAQYFAPLAGDEGLGLRDDAACLPARPGFDTIVSKDVLVEGTHFFKGTSATSLAQKALGVNVSDLAAKGAVPSVYFVGLVLPADCDAEWIKAFAEGLALGQKRFGLSLAGGDTTTSNAAEAALVISITVVGYVPQGQMIQRAGASAGDDIYVTGTLGDAALGLLGLLGKLGDDPFLAERYHLPQPRV
ncbi:MAG: thiamine-phosphate kinase, partial [Kordiimonadaceae bacterium]|nr:thiamine-phosphate kinase [Kordiimonadaceae bacterium]